MRTKTYDAITQVLDDGSWHAADDLKEATTWPASGSKNSRPKA